MTTPEGHANALLDFEAARETFLGELDRRLLMTVGGEGELYDAARYHLGTGGKRLRGLLPPWLTANLMRSQGDSAKGSHEDAIHLGLAFELLHNGTLVHDDLQDGDKQRRGQPTVWARFGMPQAVNVGTAMMLLGLARVLDCGIGPKVIADVNLALLAVIEGQALEFELHVAERPTLEAWNRMAEGKTGALFGACLLGGVRAAGGSTVEAEDAMRFGRDLGRCFQIQDDLLDLVGDKGREVPATDIAEGKISWPVAWCCQHGPVDYRSRVLEIVRTPRPLTSRAMIEEALALLNRAGAIEACAREAAELAGKLAKSRWARLLPGLLDRILAPVSHVTRAVP